MTLPERAKWSHISVEGGGIGCRHAFCPPNLGEDCRRSLTTVRLGPGRQRTTENDKYQSETHGGPSARECGGRSLALRESQTALSPYRERRKFNRSCFWLALKPLNRSMTRLASEVQFWF